LLSRDWKLKALRKILGREAFQRGDECVWFCPRHNHHRPKLNVNIKTDKVHCWVCGWAGGNLKPILYLKGKTDDAERYSKEKDSSCINVSKENEYDIPKLPAEFITLSCGIPADPYGRAAYEYVRGRGVREIDILQFKLGYCTEGEYKYRIIVPSFDSDGELNFFVGRKFYDNAGVSYMQGNFDKDIIFNDYMVDWDIPVTLVEGAFDAMVAGSNAVPLLGKELRKDSLLFRKIVTSGIRVYIALDADAKAASYDITNKLLDYGVPCSIIDVENYGFNDVGEMSKEEFKIAKDGSLNIDSTLGMYRYNVDRMKRENHTYF